MRTMKANPDRLWSHPAVSPPKGLDTSPGSPKAALRVALLKGSDKGTSQVAKPFPESELLHIQVQQCNLSAQNKAHHQLPFIPDTEETAQRCPRTHPDISRFPFSDAESEEQKAKGQGRHCTVTAKLIPQAQHVGNKRLEGGWKGKSSTIHNCRDTAQHGPHKQAGPAIHKPGGCSRNPVILQRDFKGLL